MSASGDMRFTNDHRGDEHWNAVAVASLGAQQARVELRETLRRAHVYGLTIDDLCTASGLPEPVISHLLEEVPF